MANLSADAPLRFLGPVYSEKWTVDVGVAQTIYKGGPVMIDQSVDTVNVTTAESITVAVTDVIMGIAAEGLVVTLNQSPAPMLEVYTWPTIVGFKSAVFTNADLGKDVYMSDTGTLSGTIGTVPRIGKLFKVQDGYAFVRLETPLVQTAVS